MAKASLFAPPSVPRSSITPSKKRKRVKRIVEQPWPRKLGPSGHLPAVVDGPGEAAVAAERSEVRQLLRFRRIDHRMVLPEPEGPARQCDESGNQAAIAHRQRPAPEPAGERHRSRGAIDHEPSGASIGPRGVVVVADGGDAACWIGAGWTICPELLSYSKEKPPRVTNATMPWLLIETGVPLMPIAA